MPGRTPGASLLVIDGHGATSKESFDFKRTGATKCTLYSYVFQGIGIKMRASNTKIEDALANDIVPDGYSDSSSSRIGGTPISNRILGAQNNGAGGRQWTNTIPAGFNTTNEDMNAIGGGSAPMIIQHNGGTPKTSGIVFIEISPGSESTVSLSTIIEYFNTRSYDILWMVCRSE